MTTRLDLTSEAFRLQTTGVRASQIVDSSLAILNRLYDNQNFNREWLANKLNVSKADLNNALKSNGTNTQLAQQAVTVVRTLVNQKTKKPIN